MTFKNWKQLMQTGAIFGSLCLVLLLAACRKETVRIEANVTPEPIVGEIVTLRIEAISEQLSGDGIITIQPSSAINIVSGGEEWRGEITVGEPFTHEVSICVLRPGRWVIFYAAGVEGHNNGVDGESGKLHIISSTDSASVIPGSKYKGYNPPPGSPPTPTPEPITISPECAGDKQTLAQKQNA